MECQKVENALEKEIFRRARYEGFRKGRKAIALNRAIKLNSSEKVRFEQNLKEELTIRTS